MAYEFAALDELDAHILAVAVQDGTLWTAYIGVVEGKNQETDIQNVRDRGTKLPQLVAEALFPALAGKYVWRD